MIDSRYPAFLVDLFARARQAGCVIATIRPKLLDIESIHDGDLDIVMDPEKADALLTAAWDVLAEQGIDFAVIRQRLEKIRIEIIDPVLEKTITLEVWLSLQVKRSGNFARTIPWRHLASFVVASEDSPTGFELQDEVAACYYLSHLQSKRKQTDSPVVATRLRHYRERAGLSDETRGMLDSVLSQQGIAQAAQRANERLHAFGVLGKREPAALAKHLFDLRMLQSRSSSFVTFAGPDGVGKTTLIEHVAPAIFTKAYYFKFKNTYRKSLIYHVLYFFLKKYHQFKAGSGLQKNQVDELSYNFLIVIAAFRFLLRDLANAITGKTCLADRTFSDFHITGARFHGQPLTLNATTLKLHWLTPRPRVMVHLHAPVSVIHQRKQELSEAQIAAYQKLTLASYLSQPCSVYLLVNTNRSPDDCVRTFRVMREELV